MSGIMLMLIGGKGASAPVNTVAPALSDSTPEVAQTISVSNGTWTSDTTPTFTYQWQRNVSNIDGETSSSYTVVDSDYDNSLRCVVTATNPIGADSANSNTSSNVPGAAPVNTVAPALSDTTPVEGQVLTVTNGTWTGVPTPTFTYQWQANGSNISGATSSSYTVDVAYVGDTIKCVVTAANAVAPAGVSADSNTSSAVVARTGSYLMVAGGGGGGYDAGGGGGAGGMLAATKAGGWTGTLSITIGSGGSGGTGSGIAGGDGNTSSISSIGSVTGGGGGGSFGNTPGRDGGSGGGGRRTSTDPGLGTAGQGNDGAATGSGYGSGGGGGKGAAGGIGSAGTNAGPGGIGGVSSIHGASRYYAGGGGGGSDNSNPGGSGGSGGGGDGGSRGLSVPSVSGYVNSGGGGGGGANAGSTGGSGIVIIRSNLPAYNTVGSPDITTDGADTIYTFNGSGFIQFE